MANVWRIHINPDAKKGIDPRDFCIKKGILGVGWRVTSQENPETPMDWERYCSLAKEVGHVGRGWQAAVNALHDRMKVGDLCWSRDSRGNYYLGRITGGWEYRGAADHYDADVVNVRECEWHKLGLDDLVPGKVVNSFIQGYAVQGVHDATVNLYSHHLFNQLAGEPIYPVPEQARDIDLLSLISSESCEDLVGIYLQEKGYRLIPSSCKRSTMYYEFVLRHKESHMPAIVQVKQGTHNFNIQEYSKWHPGVEIFLFTTRGEYRGEKDVRVHCLDANEMRDFALQNRNIMSGEIQSWIEFLEDVGKRS